MIKHIIFDLGNVILKQETFTVRHYFWKIFKTDRTESDKFILGFKRNIDTGVMKFEELFKLYAKKFNVSMDYDSFIKQYKRSYLSDVAGIDPNMIDIVKKLSRSYGLYIMTNTVAPHYESLNESEYAPFFKRIFRSDTNHFVKPELESYQYVLKELDAKGDECVFIDDLEVNVDGAKKADIHGLIYKSPSKLISDLRILGINI